MRLLPPQSLVGLRCTVIVFLVTKQVREQTPALHTGEVGRDGYWVMENRWWFQSVPTKRGGHILPWINPSNMKDTPCFLPSWCHSHTELTACYLQVLPSSISCGIFKNLDLVLTYNKFFPLPSRNKSKGKKKNGWTHGTPSLELAGSTNYFFWTQKNNVKGQDFQDHYFGKTFQSRLREGKIMLKLRLLT